jgi:hypothetical protein
MMNNKSQIHDEIKRLVISITFETKNSQFAPLVVLKLCDYLLGVPVIRVCSSSKSLGLRGLLIYDLRFKPCGC